MAVTRAQLIAVGRTWIDTRWHHQAALKGVGADCIGLIRGVIVEAGLIPPESFYWPEWVQFHGYGRAPYDGRLERGCRQAFGPGFPFSQAKIADVMMFKFGSAPSHLGFLTQMADGAPGILHSYIPVRRVVETHLDEKLLSRLVCCFSIPGLEE